MPSHSRRRTTSIDRYTGPSQIALQCPLDLLPGSDHEAIAGMIVWSAHRVSPKTNDPRRSQPPTGNDQPGGLYRGDEADAIDNAVVQDRDDNVVPVMVLHHENDFGPGARGR